MPTCCCRAATPRRRRISPAARVSKFWPIPRRCSARNTKEGVTGFSFWEAAGPCRGERDAPASVIVHETPETITVGVSDPTHLNTGAVRVTLSEAKAAKVAEEHPEVKVVSLSPVVLEVGMDGSLGRTRSVTLRK